ncbi:MAG: recombinase family protein [Chloroflexota bacterium]
MFLAILFPLSLSPKSNIKTGLLFRGQVIRRIFNMAGKGEGCKEIARALNKDAFRTSTGKRWGKTTIHKVLTNEAYCGTLVWGGRPGHHAIHGNELPVRVEDAWPAIIDKQTFQQIRSKMALNAPVAVHPRTVPSFYLLSGLPFCACGHAMIGRSAKSHQYYYYVCNRNYKQGKEACSAKSLPKDKLEGLIIEQVKERVLNPENLESLVKLVNDELDSSISMFKDKLISIDAEQGDVQARLSRLYDALETGKLTLDELAPRIKELKARSDELMKNRVQFEVDMVAQGVAHVADNR